MKQDKTTQVNREVESFIRSRCVVLFLMNHELRRATPANSRLNETRIPNMISWKEEKSR